MLLVDLRRLSLIGIAIPLAVTHPGEHHQFNAVTDVQKRAFQENARRGLERCADQLESSGFNARAKARRRSTYNLHRRGLATRDAYTVPNKSHLSNDSSIDLDSPFSAIFETTSTYIVNPQGGIGPYYVKGEYIRSDVREEQPGVPIILDGQFINIETCKPIEELYWDIWNCNATGVYSGVVANGNGNAADTSNLNATFLRGIQKTDTEGVVQFSSVFPGHYFGRTAHHHIVAHLDVTVLLNNTIVGGTVAHVGQLFWDQDLINEIEATSPYSENSAPLTTNAQDHVLSDETTGTTSDPVINYVKLGDSLSDGLLGWITIAVNTSATYDPSYSYVYTANGGVAQSGGSGDPLGPGGPGGLGGFRV
jgi:protocatechuate 3,4-dioxygenase beta subunit